MAEINIKFLLPEEEQEAVTAIKSLALVAAINDYDNWLRQMDKRGVEKVSVAEARQKLWELVEETGLEIP